MNYCPNCNTLMHPYYVNRYSGHCSQLCEALSDVVRLEKEVEQLKLLFDAREVTDD